MSDFAELRHELEHGELADRPENAEVVSRDVVFHGRVWDIVSESVWLGGFEFTREFMSHTGAVAVLAVDDDGRVLLINQYRNPIRSRDWELPAGLLDVAGEDPLTAAQRELGEEVDLEAEHWEPLVTFASSPGGSDERIHLYLATGLRPLTSGFERTDEEAEIVPRWVQLPDAVDAVLDGRLGNAILMIGVLALHARRR